MELTDATRIQHMIDAAEAALRFASGRSRQDLDDDEMLTFALTRAVEIIGEAASRVSSEGRRATSEVPWNAVIGMRHRLVHAYFEVDRDILWSTVQEALPRLLAQLRQRPSGSE
jgi:uncharacterized protein with HEPN domain